MDKKYESYWESIVWVIHGEATPEEEERVRRWRAADPDHERFFKQTELFLQKMEVRSVVPVFDEAAGWDKFLRQVRPVVSPRPLLRRIWKYGAAVAAVTVLVLGGLHFLCPEASQMQIRPGSQRAILVLDDGAKIAIGNGPMHISRGNADISNDSISGLTFQVPEHKQEEKITYSKLIIPQGGEYKLTLPDGTEVWLNSESELRFPSRFAKDRRVVEFRGEAYFKVVHRDNCPFYVKTNEMEVKVYGTEFNLRAYQDDPQIAATLVNGHVAVIPGKDQEEVHIEPSQQLTLSRTDGKIEIRNVDTDLYTSWKSGIYTFENASLEEIFNNIRRWYVFDVDFRETGLRELRFTGEFQKDRPIEYGLKLIRMTCEVNFKLEGNHIWVTR